MSPLMSPARGEGSSEMLIPSPDSSGRYESCDAVRSLLPLLLVRCAPRSLLRLRRGPNGAISGGRERWPRDSGVVRMWRGRGAALGRQWHRCIRIIRAGRVLPPTLAGEARGVGAERRDRVVGGSERLRAREHVGVAPRDARRRRRLRSGHRAAPSTVQLAQLTHCRLPNLGSTISREIVVAPSYFSHLF